MRQALQAVALAIWVGGVAFFALVVAPVAFSVLPTAHEAGLVVGASLRVLHWIGLGAGTLFLLLSLGRRKRSAGWAVTAVSAMLCLTAISQFVVLPAMERDRRAAGGTILAGNAAGDATQRAASSDFDRLHHWSEQMEGGVLLLGLFSVAALAGASTRERPAPSPGLNSR